MYKNKKRGRVLEGSEWLWVAACERFERVNDDDDDDKKKAKRTFLN